MEHLSNQLDAQAISAQQRSCWYRAATLTERLSSRPAHYAYESGTKEQAEKMLQHWKAQKPFDTASFFADRLAMDGITEEDLLALLQESPEALQERLSHPAVPAWVTTLSDMLQTDPTILSQTGEDMAAKLLQEYTILRPFVPLLSQSVAHLHAGIQILVQEYATLPFDPQTILSFMIPYLFQQIGYKVSKTVTLELHIARLRGHLQGETPQERFQDYFRQLSQREHLQSFLEEYSVLARHILSASRIWAEVSLTLLQRLCTDWQEILAFFAPGQEPGVLASVAGGAGDTHRNGQSVMILAFSSGWQLVYKPRALAIDTHFQELLTWVNAQGASPAFRQLQLIDKGKYGWTEFVATSDCATEEEVRRFYQRQGGYLALLYVLEASDFHHENVLAAGEHPLLVDLEALFHPRPGGDKIAPHLAQKALEHSVMHTAFLPWHFLADAEHAGLDISGLARQMEGRLSARPVSQWEAPGTDDVRIVRKRVEMRRSHNCPRLNGQEVQPVDYVEEVVNGFAALYHLLLTQRNALLANWLPRFAQDEIRFVPRATHTYSLLLQESFHPNHLRDALKRECFFDHLWLEVQIRPALARLIPAERADLLQGDIPFFMTYPASRDLWTSHGECLPAFFERSSLELAHERLKQLSEEDLLSQTWLIRASFASTATEQAKKTAKVEHTGNTALWPEQAESVADAERLLEEARAIGEAICAQALQGEGQADWFGISALREHEWVIEAARLDLYNGLPGILLFLSYLGLLTQETRYTTLAQSGFSTLRGLIEQNQSLFELMSLGAFTGLGSCIYLFPHLAMLWQEPSLLQEATNLAQYVPRMLKRDEQYNLVEGAAGSLVSLLNLYTVFPSEQILHAASACGEHLLAHAQTVSTGISWQAKRQASSLPGFAYGVGGIAWSLLRLAAVSGEEHFHAAAVAALSHEHSLFIHEQATWFDPAIPFPPVMSWSYGVPGIAFGQLTTLPYLDDRTLREDLARALEVTLGEGLVCECNSRNHSLAYGDGGILETVLTATQVLRTPSLHASLQRLTAQLLESIHQHGWMTGVPLNVTTPGLMLGLAGIGYELLRLAQPDRIPSVLMLAPPVTTGVSGALSVAPAQKTGHLEVR